MLLIDCPWCGQRDQTEFAYQGEAHLVRPANPDALSEQEWGDYLFFRRNPRGLHYERWLHQHGCRRWFNVARDTVSDRIYASYKPGERKPRIDNAPDHAPAKPHAKPHAHEPD